MDPNSDFQQKLVEYLESVHIGEFIDKTMSEVSEEIISENTKNPN